VCGPAVCPEGVCGLQIYGDGGLPLPDRENATYPQGTQQGAWRDFRADFTENMENRPLKNALFQPLFSALKKNKITGDLS